MTQIEWDQFSYCIKANVFRGLPLFPPSLSLISCFLLLSLSISLIFLYLFSFFPLAALSLVLHNASSEELTLSRALSMCVCVS